MNTRGTRLDDLIIVGGGVQGIFLALEAAGAGLQVTLVERGRIGRATTANWLGILHGGLRYLQTMDFARTHQSARAQQWFLREFPDVVKQQAFLMPLYGRGLKRPAVFRAAFPLSHIIASAAHDARSSGQKLPMGRVLSCEAVAAQFEDVDRDGLVGGALWHECVVPDTAALMSDLTARARSAGAVVIEEVEVEQTLLRDGAVSGIVARCLNSRRQQEYLASTVICAAGWRNDRLTSSFGTFPAHAFRPVLAFNLLLNHRPLSQTTLSLSPKNANGPMLFLCPHGQQILAGTWYQPWQSGPPEVPPEAIETFLEALNQCVPSVSFKNTDVVEVMAGLLPGLEAGTTVLRRRELICDFAAAGGPKGLFSVAPVKLTTTRNVARKLLGKAFSDLHLRSW